MSTLASEHVSTQTALGNLAQLHNLPPFAKFYESARTAIVIVHRKYAEQWRAALAAGEFIADTEGDTTTWTATAPCWMGVQVRIIYGTHGE